MITFVIAGIFGFIYETIFYRIDLGYFVKRGTTLGPWIPIYAYGSILILLNTFKLKNKPLLVFLFSSLISGCLEYTVGYLLYNIKGIRLWNYNTEMWNFGNIGGFVCLRSVIFFGISGLLLIYFIIPIIKKNIQTRNKLSISLITIIPFILFILDIMINTIKI